MANIPSRFIDESESVLLARDRANHTGTQPIGTIEGLTEALTSVRAPFDPEIIGATTVGTAVYTLQKAETIIRSNRCYVSIEVSTSGHNGTGGIVIQLPYENNGFSVAFNVGRMIGNDGPVYAVLGPGSSALKLFDKDNIPINVTSAMDLLISGDYEVIS